MADPYNSNTVLLFGDVHFDPFADPSLASEPAASDEFAWKGILSSSSQTAYAAYGQDTNYTLYVSSPFSFSSNPGASGHQAGISDASRPRAALARWMSVRAVACRLKGGIR